jgi:hypothetical protein
MSRLEEQLVSRWDSGSIVAREIDFFEPPDMRDNEVHGRRWHSSRKSTESRVVGDQKSSRKLSPNSIPAVKSMPTSTSAAE